MHVTCVYVEIKPKYLEKFLAECEKNHTHSVQESGILRFDVLQEEENPYKFLLYEVYENDEAAIAHKQTQHYFAWKQAVEEMMAKPRIGVKHKIICPQERKKW